MLSNLVNKIKSLEPSILAVISLAPFAMGMALGYLLRGPIGLLLSILKDAVYLIHKL